MKFPDHALLYITQIHHEISVKEIDSRATKPFAIVFGAARIVTERFD